MAKEPKKKEAAKTVRKNTVGYSAARKAGKEILKLNPGLNEVYVTSDCTAFYNSNNAHNHARALADKTVTKVQCIDTPEEADTGELIQPGNDNPVKESPGSPEEDDEPNDNPKPEE